MDNPTPPSWIFDVHVLTYSGQVPWLYGLVEHARFAPSMRVRPLDLVDAIDLPAGLFATSLQLEFPVPDEPGSQDLLEAKTLRFLERLADDTQAIPLLVAWRTDGEGAKLMRIKNGKASIIAAIADEDHLEDLVGEYFYDFMAKPEQAQRLGQCVLKDMLTSPGCQDLQALIQSQSLNEAWMPSGTVAPKPRL